MFYICKFIFFHHRTRKHLNEEDTNDMEDDIEDINMDAVTDSEEEYTETEKKLLEKVRKQHTVENFDSDEEVYGLQDESEGEEQKDDQQDSMESDIEELQEDYDMPNDRAWGSKARTFYSSDFKYTDYAVAPQKDLVNADMEEEEGKKIHLRSMEQYLDIDSVNINEVVQTIKDRKTDQKDSKQISDTESFMFMVNNFKGMHMIFVIYFAIIYFIIKHNCYYLWYNYLIDYNNFSLFETHFEQSF